MQKRTPRPDDVKLSATVSHDVWRRLRQLALEENRSLNDLLNEWIAEKLGLPPDEGQKGGHPCTA